MLIVVNDRNAHITRKKRERKRSNLLILTQGQEKLVSLDSIGFVIGAPL